MTSIEASTQTKPSISIIIPNYNGAELVERAINSCLSTNCQDIEVVVVDDKSSDASRDIISKIVLSDNRVKAVFLSKNQGPLKARLAGFDKSTSDLVAFLDADDELVANDLRGLIRQHRENDVDITIGGYIKSCTGKEVVPKEVILDYKKDIHQFFWTSSFRYLWGKIYSRKLIESVRGEMESVPFRHNEDVLTNYLIYYKAGDLRVSCVEEIIIIYFHNDKSITKTKSFDNFIDGYKAISWINRDMDSNSYFCSEFPNYFFSKLLDLAKTYDVISSPGNRSILVSECREHFKSFQNLSIMNRCWLLIIRCCPSLISAIAVVKRSVIRS